MSKDIIPKIIAHRGESAHYPENTYLALQKALQTGAAGVEFDVQLSQDHVPLVIHDRRLQRTSGKQGDVFELTASEIMQNTAGYPQRFGEQFLTEKIPSLQAIVALLLEWPERMPFVELKRSSLSHYGEQTVLDNVLPILAPLQDKFVLISYNRQVLDSARQRGVTNIGWVFDQPNEEAYRIAHDLQPQYLLSDEDEIAPEMTLWPGDWRWMLFEVNDPERAIEWAARGVYSIETNTVERYAKHPTFSNDCEN